MKPSSTRARVRCASIAFATITLASAGCSTEQKTSDLEPLPASCDELATTIGRCFHSSDAERATRSGFPKVSKGNDTAAKKLETDCAKNLKEIKEDCR